MSLNKVAAPAVVIPVFNDGAALGPTLEALDTALDEAGWLDAHVLVVDDGSTVPLQAAALQKHLRAKLSVHRQANAGRFDARRRGLHLVEAEQVLLLDARVHVDPGALAFVRDQLQIDGRNVFNAHVVIDKVRNPYARFWDVLTSAAFAEYFDHPRLTSFGREEFDRFPKGTTMFLAPRKLLVEEVEAFSTHLSDLRNANDDTKLLRSLVSRERIWIGPSFSCRYHSRTTFRGFARHALHRGTVFYDGFAHPGNRFFVVVLGILGGSLVAVPVGLRHPRAAAGAPVVALAVGGVGARVVRKASLIDTLAFAGLLTPFALAFSAGVWRGLFLTVRGRMTP